MSDHLRSTEAKQLRTDVLTEITTVDVNRCQLLPYEKYFFLGFLMTEYLSNYPGFSICAQRRFGSVFAGHSVGSQGSFIQLNNDNNNNNNNNNKSNNNNNNVIVMIPASERERAVNCYRQKIWVWTM